MRHVESREEPGFAITIQCSSFLNQKSAIVFTTQMHLWPINNWKKLQKNAHHVFVLRWSTTRKRAFMYTLQPGLCNASNVWETSKAFCVCQQTPKPLFLRLRCEACDPTRSWTNRAPEAWVFRRDWEHASPGKLSETGFCAFRRQYEQAAKTQLKNVEITQTIALQHRFSMAQRVLYVCILQLKRIMSIFKRNKIKVENPIIHWVCCRKPRWSVGAGVICRLPWSLHYIFF